MHDDYPIGPTGRYPEGKLNESDGGELQFAVGHQKGNVIIAFGAAVEWAALTPDGARRLAQSLIRHAMAIDGQWPIIELEL